MSGCRDLLFNVMEHRFTIPEIAAFLNQHGLCFTASNWTQQSSSDFGSDIPDADALANLEYWHEFETANPDTFWHMYLFTVSRRERSLPKRGHLPAAA